MQQTIFAILTNKKMRKNRVVKKALDMEFTVGVPWFNKNHIEQPAIKLDIV